MCGVWCGVDRSLKLEAVACAWCLVLGAWYYIDMVWYHTIANDLHSPSELVVIKIKS